jgi:hypothetical protein
MTDFLFMQIQINTETHHYASTSSVLGGMASQVWVAERAIPLLKRKPTLGAKELKEELENKYNILVNYQNVW